MKILLICTCLLLLSQSFTLSEFRKTLPSQEFVESLGCSDDRIKTVNDSISQCESLGVTLAAQCIKNYMFNHSNNQTWDVLSEVPDKSDAKLSGWPYDDCLIRYQRFGTFKLSYTIWKATGASLSAKEESDTFESKKASLMLEPNDDCLATRTKTVTDSINYCQNADMTFEASCIRNNIRTKSGQKWDVVVSSSQKSQYFSVRYDYADSCSVQISGFGIRKRNYSIWKAE